MAAVRAGTPPALRYLEHCFLGYRRVWRGSIAATVLNPILFLASMGLGLGRYVDDGGATELGGVPYLRFLAPGLLAASAVNLAAGESLWPVLGGFLWNRTHFAAVATPLRPRDLVTGWLAFVALRVAGAAAVFLVIAVAFDAVGSPLAVLAIPAAALAGLAIAAPLTAFTATRQDDQAFPVVMRFVVVPMFLFSGAFFPVSQLPPALEAVAWATPLWHGVELCRACSLGDLQPLRALGHAAVLVAFTAVGAVLAAGRFARRLEA